MEEIIAKERKKTTFDPKILQRLIHGAGLQKIQSNLVYLGETIKFDPNIFGEGRIAMIRQALHDIVCAIATIEQEPNYAILSGLLHCSHQMPYSLHYGMFMTCIRLLATDDQRNELLPKCYSLEVVGCYAQTEMGHGSDVQSLETTAIFDRKTDEIILNSPTISSAKFWPGDLGFVANWALVFARLLVDGEFQGVFPFLVQIRDATLKPLPGIDVGDIGPKFGFLTKDNGYLMLSNIRIPRTNMLGKYVSLNKQGNLELHGNPKIVYATMMIVRKLISTVWPKVLGQGAAIATRYSFFRKQFKDEHNNETPIIEYQLQQMKIIPIIADFYAICIAGNRIAKLADQNFKRVTEQDDDKLMNETHAALCSSKAYYSEVVNRGMEICRLSMGGHGFAEYSGMPTLIKEVTPNVTHEGENSIMYLQVSRYIMKSYKASITKKKELLHTVSYINSMEFYRNRKCAVPEGRPDLWTVEQVRILLGKSACYLIEYIHQKQTENPGGSKKQTNDKFIGIRLVELAIAHSIYNTYTTFEETIVTVEDQVIRKLLFDLCLVYGITNTLNRSNYLVESGGVEPHHLTSLKVRLESLLKSLRPHMIGLVDGFGLTESCLKSPLTTSKEPYQALLEIARQNSLNLNGNSLQAAHTIKKGIKAKL